jgi:hypothetical protein
VAGVNDLGRERPRKKARTWALNHGSSANFSSLWRSQAIVVRKKESHKSNLFPLVSRFAGVDCGGWESLHGSRSMGVDPFRGLLHIYIFRFVGTVNLVW